MTSVNLVDNGRAVEIGYPDGSALRIVPFDGTWTVGVLVVGTLEYCPSSPDMSVTDAALRATVHENAVSAASALSAILFRFDS